MLHHQLLLPLVTSPESDSALLWWMQPLTRALQLQTAAGGNEKGEALIFPSSSSSDLLLPYLVSCAVAHRPCRCLPLNSVHLAGTLPFCVWFAQSANYALDTCSRTACVYNSMEVKEVN